MFTMPWTKAWTGHGAAHKALTQGLHAPGPAHPATLQVGGAVGVVKATDVTGGDPAGLERVQ